jgi:glycosyltransferase involved in cell wall biosynthesis
LEALSVELGITHRVHLAGRQDDVRVWLAALDIFVLSSDWEGMPNAILEAMAAGLPVVATAVGGTPEVVVDGITGLLVPRGDPEALRQAIARLMDDFDLRRRMGQAGRERVSSRFDIAVTARATETLYLQLVQEKLGRQPLARKG